MKRIPAYLLLALVPLQGFAKETLRKFRHNFGLHKPASGGASGQPAKEPRGSILLKGVGELVARSGQTVGEARVAGSWRQTIYRPDGTIAFAAGAEAMNAPAPDLLHSSEIALANALEAALGSLPELRHAAKVFPPELEVKHGASGWLPYWKIEFLAPEGDRLRYLHLSRSGEVLARGELDWDGADGRAAVFPDGPRQGLREETLRDLSGDGTMTGRILHVVSALDLKVWSPELTFFFPQTDPRFDLAQAYFTIDRGYHWLKERLGVQLEHPVEVRLHVGEGGVSNAAFYHRNTIYLGTGDGETYRDMIRDPSVLIHEGIHAVIDAYAGLPSEGEGGGFNEGFADLFTALILDNPRMGEASYLKGPYRRTLEHSLMAYRDFGPGVYRNGSIVAATFWDMRPLLGTELTAKLAFRTLVRLGKGARFDDLPAALAGAARGLLSAEQEQQMTQVARNRGWRMP